ncbi:MAG: hypothetical protein WBO70_05680 [Erysipelotrichaceae bacterium]
MDKRKAIWIIECLMVLILIFMSLQIILVDFGNNWFLLFIHSSVLALDISAMIAFKYLLDNCDF